MLTSHNPVSVMSYISSFEICFALCVQVEIVVFTNHADQHG